MDQKEKMFELIDKYQESGKSQKGFCKEHGLSPSTFGYWLKKWKKHQNPGPSFIKIDSPVKVPLPIDLIIFYPNGVQIKAPNDINLLRQLITLV